MFERFTDRARQVVVTAREAAVQERAPAVDSGHVLLGVLADRDCLAVHVLADLDVPVGRVREALSGLSGPSRPGASQGRTGTAGLDDAEVEALRAIGIDAEEVVRRVEAELGTQLGQGPAEGIATTRAGRVPFGADAKKVLELALREAVSLKHRYIGTEHLLLGLLREGRSRGCTALTEAGVDHTVARAAVLDALRRTG